MQFLKLSFLLLLLLTLSSCTFTDKLWGDYYHLQEIEHVDENSFAVMVLNSNEIALLVNPGHIKQRGKNNRETKPLKFGDLAYIYHFNVSEYPKNVDAVEKVTVTESLWVSLENQKIVRSEGNFNIHLKNGSVIKPKFVDVTLTKRSKKELVIGGSYIQFKRNVHYEKKSIDDDMSFLYRVPLTPIAVTADTAIGLTKAALGAVVVIPLIPIMLTLCMIDSSCD